MIHLTSPASGGITVEALETLKAASFRDHLKLDILKGASFPRVEESGSASLAPGKLMFPWGAILIEEIFKSPRCLAFLRYAQSRQSSLERMYVLQQLLGERPHKTKGDYQF